MITRGTTPYHSFIIPLTSDEIDTIYVTYLQNGEVVVDKSKEDMSITDLNDGSGEDIQPSCQFHISERNVLVDERFREW